jgi:hypothetical protein
MGFIKQDAFFKTNKAAFQISWEKEDELQLREESSWILAAPWPWFSFCIFSKWDFSVAIFKTNSY